MKLIQHSTCMGSSHELMQSQSSEMLLDPSRMVDRKMLVQVDAATRTPARQGLQSQDETRGGIDVLKVRTVGGKE